MDFDTADFLKLRRLLIVFSITNIILLFLRGRSAIVSNIKIFDIKIFDLIEIDLLISISMTISIFYFFRLIAGYQRWNYSYIAETKDFKEIKDSYAIISNSLNIYSSRIQGEISAAQVFAAEFEKIKSDAVSESIMETTHQETESLTRSINRLSEILENKYDQKSIVQIKSEALNLIDQWRKNIGVHANFSRQQFVQILMSVGSNVESKMESINRGNKDFLETIESLKNHKIIDVLTSRLLFFDRINKYMIIVEPIALFSASIATFVYLNSRY